MHVAEILRDAGPKVMLYATIDSKLYSTFVMRENMWRKSPSPPKLTTENWVGMKENIIHPLIMFPARILRLLATNYIFIEVSPDVFANNRLSSALDTGKSVEELLAKLVLSFLVYGDE